jgi:membrane carboxypeptidase/penicillin-binding protein PbpC
VRKLFGAKIAFDGQWRFPVQDSVPDKFKNVLSIEDEYFYKHLGLILWRWSMLFSKQKAAIKSS